MFNAVLNFAASNLKAKPTKHTGKSSQQTRGIEVNIKQKAVPSKRR